MRILFLGFAGRPFRDARLMRAARALAGAGHAVTLAAPARIVSLDPPVPSITLLPLPHPEDPAFPGRGLARHVLALARTRPDVVHVSHVGALSAGYLAARLSGARLVYDTAESWRRQALADRACARPARTERLLVRRCDLVVASNRLLAWELERSLHARRVVTVVNTPEEIEPAAELPFDIRWPRDRTLTYWGAVTEGRMFGPVRQLLAERPELHLCLAGDGPLVPGFLEESGIRDRIHALGTLEPGELLALGRTCAAGLCLIDRLPGIDDIVLPNKFFEYLRAGLPILATNLPELTEALTGTGSGICISRGDAFELIAAVDHLLAHLEDYRTRASEHRFDRPWAKEEETLLRAYAAL